MTETPSGSRIADLGPVSILLSNLRTLKSDPVDEIVRAVGAASRSLLQSGRELELDCTNTSGLPRQFRSLRNEREVTTLLVGLILGESIITENPFARQASEQTLRAVSESLGLDFDDVQEAAVRSATIERGLERIITRSKGVTGAQQ